MNDIIKKILLAGDKFMPEMHLRKRGFTYNACGPLTKNKERIKQIMQTGACGSLTKTKKELSNLCKQEIQTSFIKMNSIRLAFSMIWPMVKQKI